jgi:sRNA-binding protein
VFRRAVRRRAARVRRLVLPAVAKRFPNCFVVTPHRPRPLAVGIIRDILTAARRGLETGALRKADEFAAPRIYTHSIDYLSQCKEGGPRIRWVPNFTFLLRRNLLVL